MRENRTLRLTWRGLETWHGRDSVTLADERASNRELLDLHGAPVLDPTTNSDSCRSKRSAYDQIGVTAATRPAPDA